MSEEDATDKLVYLAFRNDRATEPDTMAFIACRHCRNKTYTLTDDHPGDFGFLLLRCAACGQHMGRIGWAPETEEGKP